MSNININGISLERGKGYRIISEDELRSRAKLASNSKWIEMIRKYGGKKLKVYGYDAAKNRVWMSEDHSDSYAWKPFMLSVIYDKNNDSEGEKETSSPVIFANPTPVRREEKKAEYKPEATAYKTRVPQVKSKNNKLLKLMLIMSLMNGGNPEEPAKKEGETGKALKKA